jgi:hypothetical protein
MTAPRGRDGCVLYVDYDGVLHHENVLRHPKRGAYLQAPPGYVLFQRAELLAELLEPYPEVQIVLSTTWALQYGLTGAAKRLPEALQRRMIGGTFHSRHMHRAKFQYENRHRNHRPSMHATIVSTSIRNLSHHGTDTQPSS